MLTEKKFSGDNRTKHIGHSMYRICNTDAIKGTGKWYIHETFNDGKHWARGNAYYRNSLKEVIDIFNVISKEQTITRMMDCVRSPISVDDAYNYYLFTFEKRIYSLSHLQKKHRDGELCRNEWKLFQHKSMLAARDYETYDNMQIALKRVIRDILQQRMLFKAVNELTEPFDLEAEARKITIAHRLLHSTIKQGSFPGDTYYYNLRAFLINRIEQASGYNLIVCFNRNDASDVVVICSREEYLEVHQ